MRIGIISSLYPPFVVGGAEVSAAGVAEALAKRGHDVFAITASPDERYGLESINGVRVHRIGSGNIYPVYPRPRRPDAVKLLWHLIDIWNPRVYFSVSRILKEERPDLVHINNFKGLSLSVFSAAKGRDIPVIFTAHDYSLMCPRANLLNRSNEVCNSPHWLCSIYSRIHRIVLDRCLNTAISPSQFVLGRLTARGFFRNQRAVKLPLGIEVKRNRNRPEKGHDAVNFMFAGGLSRHKGVHNLIEAFKGLRADGVRLHICGKGIDSDEMRQLAGSDERIIFHGFLPVEELGRMYERANALVVPSIWFDNSPMVIYEAFNHATPVIGSTIGGIPELIDEGQNGTLFEPGDVKGLTRILEDYISDSSRLRALSCGAFESVKRYDMEAYLDRLVEVYSEAVAGR